MKKTLLKNGMIYDGSGCPGFIGSVILHNERIYDVVTEAPDDFDGTVIDCEGKIISPGFVDAHSHMDWYCDKEDRTKYFKPFIEQGITTMVSGHCSYSLTGYDENSPNREVIARGVVRSGDLTFNGSQHTDFFDYIHQNIPCNLAVGAGQAAARMSVTDNPLSPDPLTPEQIKRVEEIIERGINQGACLVSAGLMYPPSMFASEEELLSLGRIAKKYDIPFSIHTRALGTISSAYPLIEGGRSHYLLAVDEIIDIARKTGCTVQMSHAIQIGSETWKLNDEFLKLIEDAREEGIDIEFDIYSSKWGNTNNSFILPTWFSALSLEDKDKSENLEKLRVEMDALMKGLGFTYDNVYVIDGSPIMDEFRGLSYAQVGEKLGLDGFDAMMELERRLPFFVMMMDVFYCDEVLHKQVQHPISIFMTDAVPADGEIQNPTYIDGFISFLLMGRDGIIDMPTTIRKASGAAADRYKLNNRGYLRKGYFSDVTVFDIDKLTVNESIINQKRPDGICHVFVNGKHVLKDGELDRTVLDSAGYALRHNAY